MTEAKILDDLVPVTKSQLKLVNAAKNVFTMANNILREAPYIPVIPPMLFIGRGEDVGFIDARLVDSLFAYTDGNPDARDTLFRHLLRKEDAEYYCIGNETWSLLMEDPSKDEYSEFMNQPYGHVAQDERRVSSFVAIASNPLGECVMGNWEIDESDSKNRSFKPDPIDIALHRPTDPNSNIASGRLAELMTSNYSTH